ncbi:hypothetical protein Slin15195_G079550 [Septoria linicola]|uniref:Uncharacterized protein n=1 Tax=Septoria linicola TaxID=215465 RepID=A0A9Q9AZL1_9PEZI|nr:hypothetical protein Slin14017_G040750 [Septoria linicola]USW54636.1 hypothetical protein Slin15195_G079550 [Septoria linicola]
MEETETETIQQQIEDLGKVIEGFANKRRSLEEQISKALKCHTKSCKTCDGHRTETARRIEHMEDSLHKQIEQLKHQHNLEVARLHVEDKKRANDHSLETLDDETARLLGRRDELDQEIKVFRAKWQEIYHHAPAEVSVISHDETPGRRSSQDDQSSVSPAKVVSTKASDFVQNPTGALERSKADIVWERAPPIESRTRPRNIRGACHDTAPDDFIMQTNDYPIVRWNDSPHVWWHMRCTVCKANAAHTGDPATFFRDIEALRVHVTKSHPDTDAAIGARELWCEVSEIPSEDIESIESGGAPIIVRIVPYAGHAVERIVDLPASLRQDEHAEKHHDEPNLLDTTLDQSIPRDRGRPLTKTGRRTNPRPEGTYQVPARREPRNQESVNDSAPNALNRKLRKAKSTAAIRDRRQENSQEDFQEEERLRGVNQQLYGFAKAAQNPHQTRARVKGNQVDRT